MELQDLLNHLVESRGSDLHVKVGSAPRVRIDGRLVAAPFDPPDPETVADLARQVLPPARAEEFEATGGADTAHSVPGLGRFRVNVYRQRGSVALAIRRVVPGIPDLDTLGLPEGVHRLAQEERGLIIICGPAGAGTTTTVAALIDHVNATRSVHIATVEDPIEVLHADKMSIVSQREVGTDAVSMSDAVQRTMRQDPDALFVAELSDVETVRATLVAAETGKLVFTVMRSSSAIETIERLLEYFPAAQQRQIRVTLGRVLRGIVCQRLLDRADGTGRLPAAEVTIATPKVLDCIVEPERLRDLDQVLAEGEYYGMQTFDQGLLRLYRDGLIGLNDALAVANDPEDFRISADRSGLGY